MRRDGWRAKSLRTMTHQGRRCQGWSGIDHQLCPLVPREVGVMDIPVGVGGPSQDILAISFVICMCNTNAGKPRLCHTQQIVCLV